MNHRVCLSACLPAPCALRSGNRAHGCLGGGGGTTASAGSPVGVACTQRLPADPVETPIQPRPTQPMPTLHEVAGLGQGLLGMPSLSTELAPMPARTGLISASGSQRELIWGCREPGGGAGRPWIRRPAAMAGTSGSGLEASPSQASEPAGIQAEPVLLPVPDP